MDAQPATLDCQGRVHLSQSAAGVVKLVGFPQCAEIPLNDSAVPVV
jgi:hypothetical protein